MRERDGEGATALIKAAGNGHLGTVRALLEVPESDPGRDGVEEALEWARRYQKTEVVQYLSDYLAQPRAPGRADEGPSKPPRI